MKQLRWVWIGAQVWDSTNRIIKPTNFHLNFDFLNFYYHSQTLPHSNIKLLSSPYLVIRLLINISFVGKIKDNVTPHSHKETILWLFCTRPDLILGSINSPTHQKMQMEMVMFMIETEGVALLSIHSYCYHPAKLCARGISAFNGPHIWQQETIVGG